MDAGLSPRSSNQTSCPALLFSGVTPSPDSSGFEWPSRDDIAEAQEKYKDSAPTNASTHELNLTSTKGAV